MRFSALILVLAAAYVPHASAEVASTHVRVSADLSSLQVESCAPGAESWRLVSERFLRHVSLVGSRDRRAARVKRAQGECLRYEFDLHSALRAGSRDVARVGRDVVATADAWLYRPMSETDHDVQFALPEGMSVSAPWLPLDEARTHYRVGPSSAGSRPLVALGRFAQFPIEVGRASLDVAMLDGEPPARSREVATWVGAAARQVLLAYGEFPVPRVQVLIVPVHGAGGRRRWGNQEAVPFARVLRDGGPAVQFFVNQTAPLDEYLDDWTATHEFSHFLLPYVRRTDAWLSEGFASYYQNVLMARGGVLSERRAWRKLWEGFERGRREEYDETLAQSIEGRGPNMIMRMYWSGAALALMADVELRRRGSSLDAVLKELGRCCLVSGKSWSGLELFRKLDALAGVPPDRRVFEPLYHRWVHATEFPAVDPVLRALGVEVRGRDVRLIDTAPLAAARREIMVPAQSGS